jgi:predicted MFS family arabinose efflux permease
MPPRHHHRRSASAEGDRPARAVARPLGFVRLLAVAAALANLATVGMISFLVVFATGSGMSDSAAGALLAGASLAAVVTRLILGAWADRAPRDHMRVMATLLVGGAAGFAIMSTGDPAAIVVGALTVGASAWGWLGLMTMSIVNHHRQSPAAAVGVAMSGVYVGAGFGPLVMGTISGAVSLSLAWLVASCLVSLAAAVVLVARRLAP